MESWVSRYAGGVLRRGGEKAAEMRRKIEMRLGDAADVLARTINMFYVPFIQVVKAIAWMFMSVNKKVWAAERKARRIVGREYALKVLELAVKPGEDPPQTNMPDGAGTHVLKPNGHPWYYDTAFSGGVGGKANTRIGNQTATWQGSNIIAGPKGLTPGEEIFVPYTHGSSYILTADDIDDRREHWYYVAKDRKITSGVPTPRTSSTPAPPRSGLGGEREGGNHHAGARVFQHVAGVSAPT